MMNFVLNTRNFVSKTGNFVFKMMILQERDQVAVEMAARWSATKDVKNPAHTRQGGLSGIHTLSNFGLSVVGQCETHHFQP